MRMLKYHWPSKKCWEWEPVINLPRRKDANKVPNEKKKIKGKEPNFTGNK